MNKKSIIYYLLRSISILPRNKKIWVTGKVTGWEYNNNPPMFFDNSKYFFLYLVKKTKEKVYWITDSDSEFKLLQDLHLPVVKYNSFRGKWTILRAKYFFHHYGVNQINRILQMGSTQIDFWHGTPLKKIRYDVEPKQEERLNPLAALLSRGGCEYISSTSKYLSENVLRGAFDAEEWQMLNFGYPRMDIMKYNKEQIKDFCKVYSKSLLPYIELTKGKIVLLYMPTWRDDDERYFEKANIDFEKLNTELDRIGAIFFLKLHPLTKEINISHFENIKQISNDTDIYPFLKYVDYLVTDYSSIYFDYLPLNREIIFIPYDFENYVKNRELYFDYNEVTPGIKYKNFDDFINAIHCISELDYKKERERISALFLDCYEFDACEKIYGFFKEKG